mgnify:CR=1 FL=1
MNSQELVDILNVEQIDRYIFRGLTPESWRTRVYGGQVLAQAMNAALRTVSADRKAHSQHAYFLRPGNPDIPIIYEVDPIRDGSSFTTRRVVAIQKGKAIFNTSISFQLEEQGLSHQISMPDVPGPEGLDSDEDYLQRLSKEYPNLVTPGMTASLPMEIRRLHHTDPINPEPHAPETGIWMKAKDMLGDDPVIHQTMLTYLSDYYLMGTALLPHGVTFFNSNLQGASLDHALYFHRDFRTDDWLFYHMQSPVSHGARGLNIGMIYSAKGELVATSIQEGLIRIRED